MKRRLKKWWLKTTLSIFGDKGVMYLDTKEQFFCWYASDTKRWVVDDVERGCTRPIDQ